MLRRLGVENVGLLDLPGVPPYVYGDFFIGVSERTNPEGAKQLAHILAPHAYTCTLVPVGAGLHLKSGVNWVAGDTLLVSENSSGRAELTGFPSQVVDPAESYASNTLWINGTLLTPKGFPRTRALLETLRLPILELDVRDARRMDGGLTCMSLRL